MFLVFRGLAGRAAVVERYSLRMLGVTLRVSEIPVRLGGDQTKSPNLALGSYSSKHLLWAGEIPAPVFQPAAERLTACSHSRILSALYRATEILVQVLHRPDLRNLTRDGRIRGILSAHFPGQGGMVRFMFRPSVDQVWQSLGTEVIKKCAF